jgi:hypothetical protein
MEVEQYMTFISDMITEMFAYLSTYLSIYLSIYFNNGLTNRNFLGANRRLEMAVILYRL